MIEETFKGNLDDYEKAYRTFAWEDIKREFDWYQRFGKINLSHEAIDRHANSWRKNKVAMYWQGVDGRKEKYTFLEMKKLSNKFANVLKKLGVRKGDRVFIFTPRIPELFISYTAVPKIGAILGPLFAAFGPGALRDRLKNSGAKVLLTTTKLKENVDEVRKELPDLEHIIVIGEGKLGEKEVSYAAEMDLASDKLEVEPMNPEDPTILLYTSGTSGKPKGVVLAHEVTWLWYITSKWEQDVRDEDVFWCSADPAWAFGLYYGLFGSWLNGASVVWYEGMFDPERWYAIIESYNINNWASTPTALRMLMKSGEDVAKKYDLASLRFIASCGEPLNPEVMRWAKKVFGVSVHDMYGQTEASIPISNYACMPIKPGSMGKPFPGIQAAILDENGNELPLGEVGHLAFKPFPGFMKSIWRDREKYDEYFRIPGWYVSGDRAHKDEDGYFHFIGRADDVITTAGYRVGPFDVESALVEHPAVAEAGVIGKPDPERGEIIKAFIVLRDGYEASEELKEDIRGFVKKHHAAYLYPREIEIRDTLPRTRSGKIMRRILKAWELGLPTGDLSAME